MEISLGEKQGLGLLEHGYTKINKFHLLGGITTSWKGQDDTLRVRDICRLCYSLNMGVVYVQERALFNICLILTKKEREGEGEGEGKGGEGKEKRREFGEG